MILTFVSVNIPLELIVREDIWFMLMLYVCVCLCVCVCVCERILRVCVYTHIYVCTLIYIYTCTQIYFQGYKGEFSPPLFFLPFSFFLPLVYVFHVCMYIHMSSVPVFMCVRTRSHRIYVRAFICTQTYKFFQGNWVDLMCVRIHLTYTLMYFSASVCVYIHIYIYIYIYTCMCVCVFVCVCLCVCVLSSV